VKSWLLRAPLWVLILVDGVPFGLAMALWNHFGVNGTPWSSALLGGGLGGLLFGTLLAPMQRRQHRGLREATGDMPDVAVRSAVRASLRGPVPADPDVRAAAARIGTRQADLMTRQRAWAAPFFALMTAGACWLAVTGTPWWWAGAAFFLGLGAFQLIAPGRYRRRAALMQGSER
jgi:hypothetical protein